MRTAMTSLLCVILGTIGFSQHPLDLPNFRRAKLEYEEAVEKAKREYRLAVQKATEVYVDKLKAIQVERTKAGDLDGALAIRSVIAELDAEMLTLPEEQGLKARFVSRLSKCVWKPGPPGTWTDNFVFGADGYVYLPPNRRTQTIWATLRPGLVVAFNPDKGHVDLITVDLDRGILRFKYLGATDYKEVLWEVRRLK